MDQGLHNAEPTTSNFGSRRISLPVISRLRRSFLLDFTILFAVGALALSLVAGLAVSRYISGDIREKTIDDVAQFTRQVTATQITNHLQPEQLGAPLRDQELETFDEFIHENVLVSPIVRVNVWSPSGTVIYSSDATIRGQTFPLSDHLQAAIAGGTEAEVEESSEVHGSTIAGVDQVVEVYTAIKFDGSRQAVGAFEIYRDYGPIAHHIAGLERTIYIAIAATLAALYIVLVFLAKRGSDLIRNQQGDLEARAEQLKHLAYHDSLTGLPNATLFKDRVRTSLSQARRNQHQLAVAFVDLDRFKLVNDTLGHATGDQLLRSVGGELKELLRDSDTLARVGGDEFTILLPEITRPDDVADVAERVLNKLRQTRMLGGREFHSSASIGIALFPNDGDDAETLLRNADTAMYRAKEEGRDTFRLFTPAMSTRLQQRVALERELRRALEGGELVVQYQPQVNSSSGRIMGVEALVRWEHPVRGLLLPGEFIDLAEETGLIVPLGELVLKTACGQNKAWQEAGYPPIVMAVNLSARQFQQRGLVELVAGVLRQTRLDPRYLCVEITESAVMRDVEFTVGVLHELKRMGVSISIDDFGTGYSSLDYLKRFPVDEVKIDRSFVHDITSDPDDAAIVGAIIALMQSLHLRVVAEGVETADQLAYLNERHCHDVQGYLFGKPMSASDLERMLSRRLEPVAAR